MKRILFALLITYSGIILGQTVPQGINYQAVALDQNGQPIRGVDIVGRPIVDAEIGVRLTILEDSPTGMVLYQEEHEVLTDLYGMFNLVIGQGLQVSADPFSSINWQGDKYLQVELSIENNGSFVLSAVQQLMSVPYAFFAENAMVAQTATDVDDADADPTNEIQGLSLSNDTLYLSNGGFVVLPADQVNDADSDPSNELQILSLSNDTIYLTSGGFIVLPTDQVNDADDNPTNEIQTLSKSGSTISLTQGGSVTVFDGDYNSLSNTPTVPTKTSDLTNDSGFITSEVDGSTINELQTLSKSGSTISLTQGGSVTVFDGDYNSLSNTPTVPTKTSDLTNDSGFITSEVDGSTTNELQVLTISNDTIFLSNGGFVKLPSSSTLNDEIFSFALPDGLNNLTPVTHDLLNSGVYVVPSGKNLYVKTLTCSPDHRGGTQPGAGGTMINNIQFWWPGCGQTYSEDLLLGENMTLAYRPGYHTGYGCANEQCDFSGFLVNKTVEVHYSANPLIVPANKYFVLYNNSNVPDILFSGSTIPSKTLGFFLNI